MTSLCFLAFSLSLGPIIEPGESRTFLTFDRSGLIPIETYGPTSPQLLAAVGAAKRGDWPRAEAAFAATVKAEPRNLAAREGEAECARKLGHTVALRKRLGEAVKHDPSDFRACYELGMLDIRLATDGPRAQRKGPEGLGRAYTLAPDAWPIAVATADMSMGLGFVKGAREELRQLVKEHPDRRDFLPAYARCLMFGSIASGHYDKKKKSIVIDPPDSDWMRHPDQAMEILNGLMRTAPKCTYVIEMAGYCSEIEGNWDAAATHYARYKSATGNTRKGHEEAYRWIDGLPLRHAAAEHRPPVAPPGRG